MYEQSDEDFCGYVHYHRGIAIVDERRDEWQEQGDNSDSNSDSDPESDEEPQNPF